MASRRPDGGPLPSPDELLAFIADNPGRASRRDVARAFGVVGARRRADLDRLLRRLEAEGRTARADGPEPASGGVEPSELLVEVVEIDDDGVAIAEPLTWRTSGPPPKIRLRSRTGPGPRPVPGIGQRAVVRLFDGPEGRREGQVRRLVAPEPPRAVGVFRRTPAGDRITPADRRRAHDYRAELPPGIEAADGDLVLAEPRSARRFGPVTARVVRRLGAWSDAGAISLLAIAANDVPARMPEDATAEAARAEPVAGPGGREDLRAVPLVTIDDDDARDHDDAVFAERTSEYGATWRALVAIADVAHYVRPGSALDRAAYRRGNSVYFPDRVAPMLPGRLSDDLCSLRPGEDRPCLAVRLWIGDDGALRRWRFARGFMRSVARLTYDEVEAHRRGCPSAATTGLPEGLIDDLHGAYRALRRDRDRRGALDIDRPERRVRIGDDGRVADIAPRARHDGHRLIEELMIAANVAAARRLRDERAPVMYRVHDRPPPDKIEALREYLDSLGLPLRKSARLLPSDFAGLLARVAGAEHAEAVAEAVLRAQSQAEYGPDDIGHFGLGLTGYCHFTSPIRRYADLLVHRALIRALRLGAGGLPEGGERAFDEAGVHLTATERRATKAERDAMDRYAVDYMADRVGATLAGRIVGVGRFGLFVRLDDVQVDGLIPARRLPGGPFRVIDGRRELEGDGVAFRWGARVTVRLEEADPVSGSLGFSLVEGGDETKVGRRPGRPARRPRRARGKR